MRLILFAALCGVVWLLAGVSSAVRAEADISIAKVWLENLRNPVAEPLALENALINLVEGYHLNPWSFDNRMMMFRLVAALEERKPGTVSDEALDEAYRISRSASPAHGSLLAQRVRLLTVDREECGPVGFSEECVATLKLLLATASRRQGVIEMLENRK